MTFAQTADALYQDYLDDKITYDEFTVRKNAAFNESFDGLPNLPLSDIELTEMARTEF